MKELSFKKAVRIFLTSKEENITMNFFKGSNLLIAQLFKSKDFKLGDWQGIEHLGKNSNVLMLHFNDKIEFKKFVESKDFEKFIQIKLKEEVFYIYSFNIYIPFKVSKLIRKIRITLQSIYEFNERELLEFEVVAY